jgi:hypothetical protein
VEAVSRKLKASSFKLQSKNMKETAISNKGKIKKASPKPGRCLLTFNHSFTADHCSPFGEKSST